MKLTNMQGYPIKDVPDHLTNEVLKNHIVIPPNACPSRFFEIPFKGWNKDSIAISESEEFEKLMIAARKLLIDFIKLFEKECVFSEPIFEFKPNENMFYLKIGTLEIERFNKYFKDKE